MLRLGIKSIVIINLLLFGFTAPVNAAEPTSLNSKWELEQSEQFSSMSSELRESLKDKLVIFVAGFWNEASTPFLRYFGAALEAVQEGLQMKAIRFYPKSYAFKTNVDDLYKLVVDSYEKYHLPIILIGHSKGGLECLHVTLEHPELVLDGKVERVVLLQATIHGTPLFADNPTNWANWFTKNILARFVEGYKSLEPEEAKKGVEEAFNHFKNYLKELFEQKSETYHVNWEIVHNSIYHAPTFTEYTGRTLLTQYCHLWLGDLQDHGKKNDGLLRLEDQQYDRIGIVLDEVESDHSGLALTYDLDDSEECLSSFSVARGVFSSVGYLCQKVGIPVPISYIVGIGDVVGGLLGGHSKATQKAYFIALLGHIYPQAPIIHDS